MKSNNYICVLDFETFNVTPDYFSPSQLACLMIDPHRLEIVENSEFNTLMAPLDLDKVQPGALAVQKRTLSDFEKAPNQKVVWDNFINYIKPYKRGSTMWNSPILCGYNVCNFDRPILHSLSNHYKSKFPFHEVYVYDLIHTMWLTTYGSSEPSKLNFDLVREFLGFSRDEIDNAHDALIDVKHSAKLAIRFIKYFQNLKVAAKLKDSFSLR